MRTLLSALVAAAAITLPCGGQPPRNAVTEMAQAWSGARAAPTCRSDGAPASAAAEPLPLSCTWTPTDAARTGRVTGTVFPAEGATMVTWERPTAGARDADRVIDSLHVALAGRGLARRECGGGEVPAGRLHTVVWRDARLLVHLSRIAPATGAPRLVVIAVNDPAVLPPGLCRDAFPRRNT